MQDGEVEEQKSVREGDFMLRQHRVSVGGGGGSGGVESQCVGAHLRGAFWQADCVCCYHPTRPSWPNPRNSNWLLPCPVFQVYIPTNISSILITLIFSKNIYNYDELIWSETQQRHICYIVMKMYWSVCLWYFHYFVCCWLGSLWYKYYQVEHSPENPQLQLLQIFLPEGQAQFPLIFSRFAVLQFLFS